MGWAEQSSKCPVSQRGISIDNSRKSTDLHCMHEQIVLRQFCSAVGWYKWVVDSDYRGSQIDVVLLIKLYDYSLSHM